MQVTYYCEDEEMVEQGNWWVFCCDLLNIFAYLNEPWYRLTAYLYRSFILYYVPSVSV